MHLKATRGTFGDYGRVTKGTILKNVAKGSVDKLLKTGAYVEATEADIKASEEQKRARVPNAKTMASRKPVSASSADEIGKLRDEVTSTIADLRKEIEEALAAIAKETADRIAKLQSESATVAEALRKELDAVLAHVKASHAATAASSSADGGTHKKA